MMQIVIDIPEELYKECKSFRLTEETEGLPFHAIKTIANGIPLPKGHGELIDKNSLEKELEESFRNNSHKEQTQRAMHDHEHKSFMVMLSRQKPLFPADKE